MSSDDPFSSDHPSGDSRAIMCRGGQCLQLTEDHKPEREDEAVRFVPLPLMGVEVLAPLSSRAPISSSLGSDEH